MKNEITKNKILEDVFAGANQNEAILPERLDIGPEGEYPRTRILGVTYLIDHHRRELRSAFHPLRKMSFDDLLKWLNVD